MAKKYDTIEQAAEALKLEVTPENEPILKMLVKGEARPASKTKENLTVLAAELGLDVAPEMETVESLKIKVAFAMRDLDDERLQDFLDENKLIFTEDGELHARAAGVKPLVERRSGLEPNTVGYATIELLGNPDFADKTVEECVKALEDMGYKTTQASFRWYANYVKHLMDENPEVIKKSHGEGYTFYPRSRTKKAKTESGEAVAVGRKLSLVDAYAKRDKARARAKEQTVEAEPAGEPAGEPVDASV